MAPDDIQEGIRLDGEQVGWRADGENVGLATEGEPPVGAGPAFRVWWVVAPAVCA